LNRPNLSRRRSPDDRGRRRRCNADAPQDPESVYNTWFIQSPERLKAFRSIRRGAVEVVKAVREGTFGNDFKGSPLEMVLAYITEQKQVFEGAAHPFYWKPKLRIPDIYESEENKRAVGQFLERALGTPGEERLVREVLELDRRRIKGLGPAVANILQNTNEENLYYSTDVLGAYGASLAPLAGYYLELWEKPVEALTPTDQAFVLHETAVHLLGLGRLAESLKSFLGAVERYEAEKDWSNAALSARYLGELHMLLGDLTNALTWAQESVRFSDVAYEVTGAYFEQMANRNYLGDILHQAGRLTDAEAQFLEAERVRDETGQPIPNLFFFWGFGYCELLLTLGRTDEAIERARRALEQADQTRGSLLALAQIHLALGRALLAKLQVQASDPEPVADHLDKAVTSLRQAGHQVHLPRGLLARANLRWLRNDPEGSKADLDEALTIATRDSQGHMLLYEADCYLGYSRLHLSQGCKEDARRDLDTARKIIQETNYHRRDSELKELEHILN
jgi:tetratricopeptide (TPR) repeat protein